MSKFVPKKAEKEVISIRVSSEMLTMIDKKAAQYDMSRNQFLNQCIQYALDNMAEEDDT